MKKQYACILLALAGFLGFGAAAEAQQGEVVVTVPFEFVVANKTLPAGTYTISRPGTSELIIRGDENRTGVLVAPIQFESFPDGNPKLSFEQVGDTHVLSKVETLNGVYSIPLSRSTSLVARTRKHQISASGGN